MGDLGYREVGHRETPQLGRSPGQNAAAAVSWRYVWPVVAAEPGCVAASSAAPDSGRSVWLERPEPLAVAAGSSWLVATALTVPVFDRYFGTGHAEIIAAT